MAPSMVPLHRWGWGLKSDGAGVRGFDRTSAEIDRCPRLNRFTIMIWACWRQIHGAIGSEQIRHRICAVRLGRWGCADRSEIYRVLQASNIRSHIFALQSTSAGQDSTSGLARPGTSSAGAMCRAMRVTTRMLWVQSSMEIRRSASLVGGQRSRWPCSRSGAAEVAIATVTTFPSRNHP